MTKRFALLIIIIVLVSMACNLPSSQTNETDLVATEVALMLTEEAGSAEPAAESPDITPIPAENKPQTTQETQPAVTETPTLTPTATLTSTPTITPIGLPSGPADWSDSFVNGSRFGIDAAGYDDGNTIIKIESGAMKLTSIGGNGWRGWRLTSQQPNDYYMKAVFRTGSCSGSDQYGIILQAPDYGSGFGYYIGLTCDGRFAVQKWDGGGVSSIKAWANSDKIFSGSNQTNTISVMKIGYQYEYFINETSVAEFEDSSHSSSGYFGPFISGVSSYEFTTYLEEISYWNLP